MAIFDGTIYAPILALDSLGTGVGTQSADDTYIPHLRSDHISGGRAQVIPNIQPKAIPKGGYWQTFSYVFYNRIHLTPNPLDYGSIVQPTTIDVEVWNAFFTGVTLTSLTPTSLPGVTASPTLPMVFNALVAKLIAFTATLDGPAAINGIYTFGFAGGLNEILDVIGTRSNVVNLRHNWDVRPVERWEYKNVVMSGGSGKEQRYIARNAPRRTLELEFLIANDPKTMAQVRGRFFTGQPYNFSILEWQDASFLSDAAASGATTLLCDTTGRDFAVGQRVSLYGGTNDYSTHEVSAIGSGSLTIATPTTKAWPMGTYVLPVRTGRLASPPIFRELTKRIYRLVTQWNLTPGEDMAARGSALTLPTYRSLRVLERYSSADADLDDIPSRNTQALDNVIGLPTFLTSDAGPKSEITYRRIFANRAEFAEWVGIMNHLRGQNTPFWYLSWGFDFEIAQDTLPGDTAIKVQDWDYRNTFNVHPSRRDICIILRNGTKIYRRIVSVLASAGNTETLNLDATVGATLAIADIDRISFVRPCRLGADDFQFEFETNTVITFQTKFLELSTSP